MPIIKKSTYKAPWWFRNNHLQTVYASHYRQVQGVNYTRTRVELKDGDFIDLDWSQNGHSRLAMIVHGMESNTYRPYMLGMAKILQRNGWDTVSYNMRGSSGETNRLKYTYHAGRTGDLKKLLRFVIHRSPYQKIALVGFSLAGICCLNIWGRRTHTPFAVAAAVSVPCDLEQSSIKMEHWSNKPYMKYFMKKFHRTLLAKKKLYPEIDLEGFEKVKTFREYDGRYTVPLNGFASATQYWRENSCKRFLSGIRIPTLLINAQDDPILSPECFPLAEVQNNDLLTLDMPKNGGHVGFVLFNKENEYWHEKRVEEFLNFHLL